MDKQIENFIDYINIERNYSEFTEDNYLLDLEGYKKYLFNKKLDYKKITYSEILNYIKYLKEGLNYSNSSINRHLSALRSFYNYLLRENIVTTNPYKLIKGPKQPLRLPNYLKYSEFETMIKACDDTPLGIRNKCLLEVLLATGARINEVTNIKGLEIDLKAQEIKVHGKGNKERICYFGVHCKESIKDYLTNSRIELLNGKKSEYLFINHIGTKLTPRGVRTIIDSIIKKACLQHKVTPHTFRHTFATMLLNEGCDLKSVQELLGHANMSTTSIYTHVTNDKIKEVYLHTHPRSKNT